MHLDHTGSLIDLLSNNISNNRNISIYLPLSASTRDIKQILSFGVIDQKIHVVSRSQKIIDSFYSTGSLGGFIKEQSLIVDTKKGLVIITGCAHPGIVHIVNTSLKLFSKKPLLVLGGFHLFNKDKREISKIIDRFKEMQVKYVAPCHCSGDNAKALFKKEYKDHYIQCGTGKVISTSNLI